MKKNENTFVLRTGQTAKIYKLMTVMNWGWGGRHSEGGWSGRLIIDQCFLTFEPDEYSACSKVFNGLRVFKRKDEELSRGTYNSDGEKGVLWPVGKCWTQT